MATTLAKLLYSFTNAYQRSQLDKSLCGGRGKTGLTAWIVQGSKQVDCFDILRKGSMLKRNSTSHNKTVNGAKGLVVVAVIEE